MNSATWTLVLGVCGLSVVGAPSVSPILLVTTYVPPTEQRPTPAPAPTSTPTPPPSSNHTGGLSCVSLLPPRRGSYYVEQGTGVSVGSILVFWCREGYQLVGSEKISCLLRAGVPRWSNYLPVCEKIYGPVSEKCRHFQLQASENDSETEYQPQMEHTIKSRVFTVLVHDKNKYKYVRFRDTTETFKNWSRDVSSTTLGPRDIPKPDDQGLRMALLVSVVSGVVILVMTVSFIMCCIQERMSKKKEKNRTGRSRRREKRHSTSRRSPSWLVREELDWEAFPPPKIFNLSQRFERAAPPGSPLYPGVAGGYENRGYERSQESLLRNPHPGVYHADSQVYPHLVLQRVQTAPPAQSNPPPTTSTTTVATTPVYLHISTPPRSKTSHRPPRRPNPDR